MADTYENMLNTTNNQLNEIYVTYWEIKRKVALPEPKKYIYMYIYIYKSLSWRQWVWGGVLRGRHALIRPDYEWLCPLRSVLPIPQAGLRTKTPGPFPKSKTLAKAADHSKQKRWVHRKTWSDKLQTNDGTAARRENQAISTRRTETESKRSNFPQRDERPYLQP